MPGLPRPPIRTKPCPNCNDGQADDVLFGPVPCPACTGTTRVIDIEATQADIDDLVKTQQRLLGDLELCDEEIAMYRALARERLETFRSDGVFCDTHGFARTEMCDCGPERVQRLYVRNPYAPLHEPEVFLRRAEALQVENEVLQAKLADIGHVQGPKWPDLRDRVAAAIRHAFDNPEDGVDFDEIADGAIYAMAEHFAHEIGGNSPQANAYRKLLWAMGTPAGTPLPDRIERTASE